MREPRKLFRLLAELQICASNSEAQRKIKGGAVYIAVGDSGQAGEPPRVQDVRVGGESILVAEGKFLLP